MDHGRTDQPTDGPTDGPTDQQTDPLIYMRGRIWKNKLESTTIMFFIITSKRINLQTCATSQIVGNFLAILDLMYFSKTS